jgi:hypothetical protein
MDGVGERDFVFDFALRLRGDRQEQNQRGQEQVV